MTSSNGLPPDLFDQTTLLSLASTVAIVLVGVLLGRAVLPASTPTSKRFLFIWHATDAICHTVLEGSFLYHCFFSSVPLSSVPADVAATYFPTPHNFLGTGDERVFGSQVGDSPFAALWRVYARADKRWAGVDLGVVSLELLTVVVDTALALTVCYCLSKKNPMANVWMIVLATCELYGGFMTFCPEWLVGSINLDTSNFMYKWLYLVFFNMVWVVVPLYALVHAVGEISGAFKAQAAKSKRR
ncbi:related to C-8,7 sterol isomerase/emopamil-binding protein [Cephalotrichum gorgonifer]|uniref:Related to C-8,7 sterol isomerase/emopamil-binding protein n=1 Tax=Cephalotrichum gorgonifer TaxID=2041049 RepID=A0AAE8MS61_9PEZI|nr:related to C-8,7 sterol isomerase/emopamil-binding protein [Cephalotrichum gorgonifer]